MRAQPCGYDEWDTPENECSPDLKHKENRSEIDLGFLREDLDFHEPGAYERRDRYGAVVTHQNGRTRPSRRYNYDYNY